MKKKDPIKEGIEITTFKIKGCTAKEFIRANSGIDSWLKLQPGFQSRYMAEQSDGTIVDMLIWDSVEQGTSSMHRLMDEMAHFPVHDMIDQRTVSWNIYPVLYSANKI